MRFRSIAGVLTFERVFDLYCKAVSFCLIHFIDLRTEMKQTTKQIKLDGEVKLVRFARIAEYNHLSNENSRQMSAQMYHLQMSANCVNKAANVLKTFAHICTHIKMYVFVTNCAKHTERPANVESAYAHLRTAYYLINRIWNRWSVYPLPNTHLNLQPHSEPHVILSYDIC